MLDQERLKEKFKKYRSHGSAIYAIIAISLFALRDLINNIVVFMVSNNRPTVENNKALLFIEPVQQGFGDLIFQLPIFECWYKRGHSIDILCQKNHDSTLFNNPHVSNIYKWKIKDLTSLIRKSYGHIVYLGRDTLKENILGLLKFNSSRIILDSDIKLWKKCFLEQNSTQAWQTLIGSLNLGCKKYSIPKFYFSDNELSSLKEIRINSINKKKIGFIVGVQNRIKRYGHWNDLLKRLSKQKLIFKIFLYGKNNEELGNIQGNFQNLVDKLSYRNTLIELASCDLVIGPEGSLIHAAAVLGTNTIVLENAGSYNDYSDPRLLKRVKIIDAKRGKNVNQEIMKILGVGL